MPSLDFDPESLPWTDRDDFTVELDRRLELGALGQDDADALRRWRRDGYVIFPGLLKGTEIDHLLGEVERVWTERPPLDTLIEGQGVVPLPEAPERGDIGHHHYRLLDLQDVSETVRHIVLAPRIVRFLRLLLDRTPVAMQSLYFEYGSEQRTHQDFPYVQAQVLSHLVGCWIACDEVGAHNGPLFYYRGSHRLPKFDWGGGSLVYDGVNEERNEEFVRYLDRSCAEEGLDRHSLSASKGDVIFWHAALAHGGAAAEDPSATRKSFVVHFSSRSAYPRDRRTPSSRPRVYSRNDGLIYLRRSPSLTERVKSLVRRTFRSRPRTSAR